MTIAAQKKKSVTKRYSLVRLAGRRNIANQFTSLGSDVYEMTWPLTDALPFALYLGAEDPGNAFNRVTTVATDGDWSFDESTRALQVKLVGQTPADTGQMICSFYLFFSSAAAGDKPFAEDPEDLDSTVRNWRGRLMADPTTNVSFENLLAGVFTIAGTNFSIANEDAVFEEYCSSIDSYYRTDFRAWVVLNGEVQRTFTGLVSSLDVGATVSFNVLDSFSLLNAPAKMTGTSVIGTSGHPNDVGKPIPVIYASDTYSIRSDDTSSYAGSTSAGTVIAGTIARCSTYSPSLGSTVNRTWRCCRLPVQVKNQTLGSVTRVLAVDSVSVAVKFSSYSDVRIGDTMKWTYLAVVYYGTVIAIGTMTLSGNTYDIRIATSTPTIGAGATFTALPCFSAFFQNTPQDVNGQLQLLYGRDYTISQTSSGSFFRISMVFVNNAESALGLSTDWIDPGRYKLYFTLRANSPTLSHGAVLKQIIEEAGMTCNAASFTQADADLVENVCVSIPNIDEESYRNYKDYVADFCASSLGFVRLNNANEVEYHVMDTPAAGDTKDEALTLGNEGTTATIEYQDIVSSLTPDNPHIGYVDSKSLTTYTSDAAVCLHGITNAQDFKHVMGTFSPSRINDIMAVKGQRRVTYQYATATDDIDSLLGDDVTIETDRILDAVKSANVKIVGLEKSAEQTVVTVTDLLGL